MSAALPRAAWYFALWAVLIGTAPADLAAGIVPAMRGGVGERPAPASRPLAVAALRTAALLRALRAPVGRGGLGRRAPRVRVAARAAHRLRAVRARPVSGHGARRVRIGDGLLPGTVPAADDGAALTCHCLDTAQPVAEELRTEEAAFARVVGEDAPRA